LLDEQATILPCPSSSRSTIRWSVDGRYLMQRVALRLLCNVLLACTCFAQSSPPKPISSPQSVSLCDLTQNPKSYNGQWITVHAGVSMEFEDFSLYDPACKERPTDVWLTFGGDQDEVVTYCCVNRTRKRSVDIEVEGHRIPLSHNDSLREFLRVLQTERLRRPDGHQCAGNECYFYRPLSATITGMFFAGGDSKSPGYGHMGCCHLLVISQVLDVSAERTPVPAGGKFQCSLETWNADHSKSAEIRDLLTCPNSQSQDCNRSFQIAFSLIADHWRDHVDIKHGHTDESGHIESSLGSWISADLMNRYEVLEKESTAPPTISVTRQVCIPLSGDSPRPSSHPVACNEYAVSWADNEGYAPLIADLLQKNQFEAAYAKIAEASKVILAEGDQSWRSGNAKSTALHALQSQAQKWGVVPDSALAIAACNDVSLEDQKNHLMDCGWYASDGMQVFDVRLQKPKSARATDVSTSETPWAVTSIDATVCH